MIAAPVSLLRLNLRLSVASEPMRNFLVLLCLVPVLLLTSCGTGPSGSGASPSAPRVSAIQVSVASTSIAAGYTDIVHATATMSDGSTQNITTTATWSSAENSVATVRVVNGQALIQGLHPGTATITALYQSVSGGASLTVTSAVLTGVAVNPPLATVALGLTQQFRATGTFSDGSTADITNTAVWSTTSTAVTISSTGLASTKAQGSCTVTATAAGVSAAATINVAAPQLVSIAVAPTSATVPAGSVQAFTATGTYTDGSQQDITQSTSWTSSNPSVAVLNVPGQAQTVIAGVAIVNASLAGIQGASTLRASQSSAATGVHIGLRANIAHNPGLDNYSDVVADGNFAYLASWHNTAGVEIYDISNPDNPFYARTYLPPGGANSLNMQGIQVLNGIGYFASDNTGDIYIVDLSNPASPSDIAQITHQQLGQNNVHDITLDATGQHLYVPGYPNNSAVQVWNVSNPHAPVYVRTIQGSDPNTVHDVTVANNRLFLAGWGFRSTGVESSDIFDVTNIDTQQPVLLGSFNSGPDTQDVSFSSDGKYVFCPHELSANGDVAVYDISNPANPSLVADIQEGPLGLFATSPSTSKVMGNYLYVAWYQAGLAVFDVSNPTNPILVGNYDTWPGYSFGGTGGGDGDWGVWPSLGQNEILLSDRSTGVYILDASGVSSSPALLSLGYVNNPLTGSITTTGTVYLVGIAGSGGWPVSVISAKPAIAPPPGSLLVPAGAHSVTFTQSTTAVATKTPIVMTASDGIFQSSTTLTVLAAQLVSMNFSANTVPGGNPATGTVNLDTPAQANVTVSLSIMAGASAVASMPGSVVVSAGSSSANWIIQTNSVSSATVVTIKASANGSSVSGSFTVQ